VTPTERLREIAERLNVKQWADVILNDPRFPIWSGSSRPELHHYGDGGLSQHVLEVAELCLLTNGYYKVVDDRPLFLAALFHDAGKMWDYDKIPTHKYEEGSLQWQGTRHKRLIHHISRSAIVWSAAIAKVTVEDKSFDPDDVLHAILSHHGRREWGSPVTPNTKLAWILHLCDGISARVDDCERHDPVA
jgi:3'-5' exoribonuclease